MANGAGIAERLMSLYCQLNHQDSPEVITCKIEEITAQFIILQNSSHELEADELNNLALACSEASQSLASKMQDLEKELSKIKKISRLAMY